MNFLKKAILFTLFLGASLNANQIVEAYGGLYSEEMDVKSPNSIQEVQTLVKSAKKAGKKVTVFGAGLSQGKHSLLSDALMLDMRHINHIQVQEESVVVGAGAKWSEVQQVIGTYGLSLKVMQGSNIFSVGGSLSANCHGWDFRTGSIQNVISEITLVNAEGEIETLKPNDSLFSYVIGGYGCFGVIVEAKIDLTKNVLIHEKAEIVEVSDYVRYFKERVLTNPRIAMHRYRLMIHPKEFYKKGVVTNYEIIDENPITSEFRVSQSLEKLANRGVSLMRNYPFIKQFTGSLSKRFLLQEKVVSRNESMAPPANFHFAKQKNKADWLQEFFVPPDELEAFLDTLASTLIANNVNIMSTTVRYVRGNQPNVLAYAPNEDCFAVVVFFSQSLEKKEIDKTRIWVQQVIDDVLQKGGTYYLPYHHFATPGQFRLSYSNWEQFKEMKEQIDPEAVFQNAFYQEYFTKSSAKDSSFRDAFKSAEGLRTEVGDFLNNILMHVSKKKFFSLLDRILSDPFLEDQAIYKQLQERISEARGNPLGTVKRKWIALQSLKKELKNLLKGVLPKRTYQGYVEIGYPGRMIKPLKTITKIKKPIHVFADYESALEAGIPAPYTKCYPLNQFAPLTERLEINSVDLVSCFIGLHHIPEDKLEPFIESIAQVLRPGGIFILMDHDVDSQRMEKVANMIHTIFNASMDIDPLQEKKEIRNFHSNYFWSKKLKKHGLVRLEHPPLLRSGDSTKNTITLYQKEDRFSSQGDKQSKSQVIKN